ncbi:MAG: hypothetical protein HUK18_02810, partial [Bacteroidales bacterium]|nr:hypothetical protein [Bacteroidales bacterium]
LVAWGKDKLGALRSSVDEWRYIEKLQQFIVENGGNVDVRKIYYGKSIPFTL